MLLFMGLQMSGNAQPSESMPPGHIISSGPHFMGGAGSQAEAATAKRVKVTSVRPNHEFYRTTEPNRTGKKLPNRTVPNRTSTELFTIKIPIFSLQEIFS